MRRLTDDVLRMALDDCRRWRSEGRTWSVAVNLSARCLVDPSLPHDINTTVRRAGLTPDALQLEVTESAVMADPDRALAILGRLCDLGYELALDDFGTGHSSLAYLHRLPVTWLKVDRSFVGPMGTDPAAATIMRSTLALARSLRVRTVAEGVEQSGDLGTLRRLGCTAAQGHGLSPAVPVGQVPGAVARIEHRARGRLAPGSPVAYATVG